MNWEALWIRTRGWLRLALQLASVAGFLLGAFIVYSAMTQQYGQGFTLFDITLTAVTLSGTEFSGSQLATGVGVLLCLLSIGFVFGSGRSAPYGRLE